MRHDGPHQPADVVARRTADGVQRVAHSAFQPAAIHAVVTLGVADHRAGGLSALEPTPLQRGQSLVLAPVDDLHARVVGVYAPVAQIHDGLLRLAPQVLQQIGRLLELLRQCVAVKRVTGELEFDTYDTQVIDSYRTSIKNADYK